MPSLIVCEPSGREIPDKPKVAIGGACAWKVSSPDGPVSNARWTVNGAIKNYCFSERTSAETPASAYVLQLTTRVGDTAEWYWAAAGKVVVRVSGWVAGVEIKRKIVVNVSAGEIVEFSSETDTVKVAKIDASHTSPALTFGGDAATKTPGIKWTVKLVAPPARGDFSFTQTMTIDRKFTLEGGKSSSVSSSKTWVLDESFHYGVSERGIAPDDEDEEDPETVPCLAYECLTLEEADSPSTMLMREQDRPTLVRPLVGTYKRVEVKEAFRLFLMYRPRGGIWVSLADLSWSWEGVAEYQVDKWVLVSEAHERSPSGKVRVSFPRWKGNRDDLM